MTAQVIPFHYQATEIRVVMIDDAPWFVLGDLCRRLGLTNVVMVAQRLDQRNVSQAEVPNAAGFLRQTTVVDEAGMYEVIIRSDKPEAVDFRRWVTSEVLPSIRRTGGYSMQVPRDLPSALRAYALEIEAHEQTQKALAEADDLAKALTGPAVAWLDLADTGTTYAVEDAGRFLGSVPGITMSSPRLWVMLETDGVDWIYHSRSKTKHIVAKQHAINDNFIVHKPGERYWNEKYEKYMTNSGQVRVTVRGMKELYSMLKPEGTREEIEALLRRMTGETGVPETG